MSKTVIGLSFIAIVCAAVFVHGLPQSDGDNLQGRYVLIHTEPDYKLVCRLTGTQRLGDRVFAVCEVEDARKKVSRTLIPVDSFKMVTVFDSKEEAFGGPVQANQDVTVVGQVTLRGKPLVATIRFHGTNGLAHSGETSIDGKYELKYVPVGRYKVTIERDNVPSKYRSLAESQISVEVKMGMNAFDFALD